MTRRWAAWLAGAAFGLLLAAAVLWVAGRTPDPSSGITVPAPLLPESDGALERVVLHFVPSSASLVEETHRDFLASTSPDVRVVFVIPGSRGAVRLAMSKLILPEIGHLAGEAVKTR